MSITGASGRPTCCGYRSVPPASTTASRTQHPHGGVDIGWNQVVHEHRPSAELIEC